MGGCGSGRHGGKSTTGDMWALDIRRIQRAGRLKPGQSFVWKWTRNGESVANIKIRTHLDKVTLDDRTRDRGGEWESMIYPVRVSWTPCNYGGSVYGGKLYACRHCHKLGYRTQREQAHDRAGRKADKLRDAWLGSGHLGRQRLQAKEDALGLMRWLIKRWQG
jgi:hypothetical protein